MLKAGDGLISIEKEEKNGAPYIYINLNKEKIWTVGKKAVGDFLLVIKYLYLLLEIIFINFFFRNYKSINLLLM